MQYNTEFYKLLRQAVYDDTALVRVLDKIMKLINSNSKDDDGEINEDLKSELITYSVELIRNCKSQYKIDKKIQNRIDKKIQYCFSRKCKSLITFSGIFLFSVFYFF